MKAPASTEVPILVVQEERSLPTGEVVVAGPAYQCPFLCRRPISVFVYSQLGKGARTVACVDFSNMHMLTSSEAFGFDPLTEELPLLRRFQNYSTAIVRGDMLGPSLIGAIVVSADWPMSAFQSVLQLAPNILSRYHELAAECRRTTRDEHVLLRYEASHSGFFVVGVRDLLENSTVPAIGMAVEDATPPGKGDARLFCLGSMAQSGNRQKCPEESFLAIGRILSASPYGRNHRTSGEP